MEVKIIGVGGGTGSGKSTFAENLRLRLAQRLSVGLISMDSYYIDRSGLAPEEREGINYDHPDSVDFVLFMEHLKQIRANERIQIPVYNFKTHLRTGEKRSFTVPQVVIVEGILIYAYEEVRKLFDYKIFIDVPRDLRLMRRIQRDMLERNRSLESIISQYVDSVRDMDIQYVLPTKNFADLIVPQGGLNNKAMDLIEQALNPPNLLS